MMTGLYLVGDDACSGAVVPWWLGEADMLLGEFVVVMSVARRLSYGWQRLVEASVDPDPSLEKSDWGGEEQYVPPADTKLLFCIVFYTKTFIVYFGLLKMPDNF